MSYSGWMFLCAECRIELVREKEQDVRHAHLMASVEVKGQGVLVRASPQHA